MRHNGSVLLDVSEKHPLAQKARKSRGNVGVREDCSSAEE
jgi:hypothetical protein